MQRRLFPVAMLQEASRPVDGVPQVGTPTDIFRKQLELKATLERLAGEQLAILTGPP